jgi:hypothetical protein
MLTFAGLLAAVALVTAIRGFQVFRAEFNHIMGSAYPPGLTITSCRGRLTISHSDPYTALFARLRTQPLPSTYAWSVHDTPAGWTSPRYDAPTALAALGFDWQFTPTDDVVTIPYWFPVGALATTGWLLGRPNRLVRRRVRLGLCPACGYDVSMTPARCPECGYA